MRPDGPSAFRALWKGFPGEPGRVESRGTVYQAAFGGSRLGKYIEFCGDSAIDAPLAPANRLAYSLSKRTVPIDQTRKNGPSADVATGRFFLMGGDRAAVVEAYVLSWPAT